MAKKILFVDDEADWRFMVSEYLKEAGHEVLTAKDGSEAIDAADKAKPDLMVIDLNLSGESGLALMVFLLGSHPGVPVILHTGLTHDETAVTAMMKKGAYQYLQKTTLNALLKAVQEAPAAARLVEN